LRWVSELPEVRGDRAVGIEGRRAVERDRNACAPAPIGSGVRDGRLIRARRARRAARRRRGRRRARGAGARRRRARRRRRTRRGGRGLGAACGRWRHEREQNAHETHEDEPRGLWFVPPRHSHLLLQFPCVLRAQSPDCRRARAVPKRLRRFRETRPTRPPHHSTSTGPPTLASKGF
jgi:hypothetical protein